MEKIDVTESPDVVYHYTDAAGLIGIITKRELWATDALFLNDPDKLKGPLEFVTAEFVKRIQLSLDKPSGDPLEQDRMDLLRMIAGRPIEGIGSSHVVCFSESKDSLSQWRGYGDGTNGFAIGFRASELLAAEPRFRTLDTPKPLQLAQVVYGEAADTQLLRVVQEVLDEVDHHPDPTPAPVKAWPIADRLVSQVATVKRELFHEEREWRLLLGPLVGARRFRAAALGVIPYVPIAIRDLSAAIETVVVGPGSYQDVRASGAQALLDEYEIRTRVEVSSARYRP